MEGHRRATMLPENPLEGNSQGQSIAASGRQPSRRKQGAARSDGGLAHLCRVNVTYGVQCG